MITEAEKNRLAVGYKQTLKALSSGKVQKLFVASDVLSSMLDEIEEVSQNSGCETYYIPTKRELGKMCGIHVGASCAAVLY